LRSRRGPRADHGLTAFDIRDALVDRIIQGLYPKAQPLPSVRELASEFGVSPSTVSRALQLLARQGHAVLRPRQRAISLGPAGAADPQDEIVATLKRLAVRWRLWGRDRRELADLVSKVLDDVFRPSRRVIFVECNPIDLQRMAEEVGRATGADVAPLLIEQLRPDRDDLAGSVILTPYFHLAEVRGSVPKEEILIPLNFVPENSLMRTLAELPASSTVGVIGANERSRTRLEGLVHQYSLATVLSTIADRTDEVERLLAKADVIVTTHAARLDDDRVAGRRVIYVRFVLQEGAELDRVVQLLTS
jgi:DNA-binding transcriptional regulator YhcF (GntR family)